MPLKSTLSDMIRVQHMLDATREALSFIVGRSKAHLYEDRQLLLSLIKEIEIIGEAASKVSASFRRKHSIVPWDLVIATRHRLIHGYFDIDQEIVWITVSEELPALIKTLESIVKLGNQ